MAFEVCGEWASRFALRALVVIATAAAALSQN
jgi:hypothetical protein